MDAKSWCDCETGLTLPVTAAAPKDPPRDHGQFVVPSLERRRKGLGRSTRVTYSPEFSLEAAADLLRIAGVVGSASTIRTADVIRRRLEVSPCGK